jgi:hypothetical protein
MSAMPLAWQMGVIIPFNKCNSNELDDTHSY